MEYEDPGKQNYCYLYPANLFGFPVWCTHEITSLFLPVVTPSPCNNLPTPDRCLQMKSHSVMAESSFLGDCGVGGFIVRGRGLGT